MSEPTMVTLPAAALKLLLVSGRVVRDSSERVLAAIHADPVQDREYQALCGAIQWAEAALHLEPTEAVH